MTRVHAYLARIKDQEKEVIAVEDGMGKALCISTDKKWTFTRNWESLEGLIPLVESDGREKVDYLSEIRAQRNEIGRLTKALEASRDSNQRSARAHAREKKRADRAEANVAELFEKVHAPAGPEVTRDDIYRTIRPHIPGGYDEVHLSRTNSAVDAICDLLGIEAEDPIEARARELHELAYPGENALEGARHTCRKIAEGEARLRGN